MTIRPVLRAFIVAASLLVAAPSFAAEVIGVVGSLQGTATAGTAAAAARSLKVGDQIFLDEEVTTDAGSKLQLMLNDRSTITLNPNSKVKVREFAYNPNSDSGSMAMEGVKGAFRFIGGALSKQNPVTIKTPVSSIGIRGGIADTNIAPNGATDAVFLYGDAMTMTNENGQTVEVTTPGQGLSMQTPSDMPTFTPPNVVQQIMGTFGPAPAGDNAGASNGSGGASDTAETTGGTTESAAGTENGTTESKDTAETTGGDTSSGFSMDTKEMTTSNVMDGMTTDMKTAETMTATTSQMTTTAGTTTNSGTATGSTIAANAEFKGRYGETAVSTGSNTKERGAVSAARSGDQLIINATEFAPTSGANHIGRIPVVTSAGYNALSTAFTLGSNDTTQYTGFAYASPGLDAFYYHLDEVGGTGDLNMFIGRQIPQTLLQTAMNNSVAWSNNTPGGYTGNISYYKFAPDLLTYDGTSNTPLGFFDYGIKDIALSPITSDRTEPFGIAVDWANKRFLSGYMHWENSGGLSRDFVMAFGKVNLGADGAALNGAAFDFTQNGTNVVGLDSRQGTIQSGAGTFYGNAANQIESLMVEGTAPAGHSIMTPALRVTGVANVDESRHTPAVTTMKGYAAGHFVQGVNGTPTVTTMWNTHPNGVTVTLDNATSNASGSINVFDADLSGKTVDATFGGANSASAYLSKDLYASQQATVQLNNGMAGSSATPYTAPNGFIANADALANSNVTGCSTCAFVHWGVWAGEVNRGTTSPVVDAYTIPYVAGQVTENMQTAVSPNFTPGTPVTYTGAMIGSEYNPTTGTLQRLEGTFESQIDLANRTVNTFTGNNGGTFTNITMSGGPAPIPGTGLANFSLGIQDAGAVGTVNGSLFGPQADNVAGNYNIYQTTGQNIDATGVFIGDRP